MRCGFRRETRPDAGEVEEEPVRKRLATLTLALPLLSGCGTVPVVNLGCNGCFPPQLEGTIARIHPGSRTILHLVNVQEILKPNEWFHHYATLTVTIGPGRWVGPGHWQGAHDAMDLFVGEPIMATPGRISATIAGQPVPFQGVVYRIQGNRVTLQKIHYVGDTGHGLSIVRLMPTLTVFHIAPYTRLDWEGNSTSIMPPSGLRVDQFIDGTWEGSPSYPIADQGTIFPSAAAFAGTPLQTPSYPSLHTVAPKDGFETGVTMP